MRFKPSYVIVTSLIVITFMATRMISCTSGAGNSAIKPAQQADASAALSHEDQVARGQYLANLGGCHDCHSPKIFTPTSTQFDSSRLLSGYSAESKLPPIDERAFGPDYWMLFNRELTAYAGPWGVTYAINLTPDSATGIGAWSENDFIKAIKTGRHLGQEGGRPILPPMPWVKFAKLTEEDLKAVFAYLRTIPPYYNKVPAAESPEERRRLYGKTVRR